MKKRYVLLAAVLFFPAADMFAEDGDAAPEKSLSVTETAAGKDPRVWGEPAGGLALAIWSQKSEYALGEPILALAQFKNADTKERSIFFYSSEIGDCYGLFGICEIDMKYSRSGIGMRPYSSMVFQPVSSEEVPLTSRGKAGNRRLIDSGARSSFKPDATSPVFRGWMNLWYDMSRPGEYRIVASKAVGKDERGEPVYVKSNEMVLKISDTEFEPTRERFDEFLKAEESRQEKERWAPVLEAQREKERWNRFLKDR